MSVDTRTHRGLPRDEPVLSTVKVPCDPAQVIVNHASFRVRLPTPPPVSILVDETAPLPRVPAAPGRRRPVVWTGRSAPGDLAAGALLQAVRAAGHASPTPAGAGATRVLPRVSSSATAPVVAPRGPRPPEVAGGADRTRLLPPVPPIGDADDLGDVGDAGEEDREGTGPSHARGRDRARRYHQSSRQLSLGLVLLPLRLVLGFMAIYAGMGKLTDPVYFDGGRRGSLYTWLDGLEPWSLAAPLHGWALAHPVGAGLTVAFTQIIVGVLTVFGLWQRLAAGLGALLSLALLVTVGWSNGPAYDTPDIFLCAAWSPLLIAGAPVYSLDARLAGEAWRRLGPRAPLGDLRRRVVRRGGLIALLLLGSALLLGSLLGGAVRSSEFATVPEPGEPPRNHLPGQQLPGEGRTEEEDEAGDNGRERPGPAGADGSASPEEAERGEGPTAGEEPGSEPGAATQGPQDSGAPAAEQTVPAPQQPAAPPQSDPEPAPADPATGGGGTGDAAEPAPETPPADDGGDRSGLSPIGGLLG
ncbi:DoxX family membrane protein [Streptomyces sp. DSM 44917]|uniref:DoxX family membrane protein n=1 Tax=Streptomyces boetiae TaxID=3075541 RepID=A0ABU2L1Q3_9ACTN|nr:DoxX family membrane protein [Streptomyces sp. DSM 44917]MDT0305492.1 DoxX family membrane protein [Streptomyces sp. DSM 44917]